MVKDHTFALSYFGTLLLVLKSFFAKILNHQNLPFEIAAANACGLYWFTLGLDLVGKEI